MAIVTPTTASVTATNGLIFVNESVNTDNIVAVDKVDLELNTGDPNKYPGIKFTTEIPDNSFRFIFWAYGLADTAIRDADFLNVLSAAAASGSILTILQDESINQAIQNQLLQNILEQQILTNQLLKEIIAR